MSNTDTLLSPELIARQTYDGAVQATRVEVVSEPGLSNATDSVTAIGWLSQTLNNQITINYTDSTKSQISTIVFSDGRVITFTSGSTTDTFKRTS